MLPPITAFSRRGFVDDRKPGKKQVFRVCANTFLQDPPALFQLYQSFSNKSHLAIILEITGGCCFSGYIKYDYIWYHKLYQMQEAYIVAGFHTAVTKSKRGGFRFTRPDDLAIDVIKGLMASLPGLEARRVDDVIVGNAVPEAEQGLQVGRIIAARALGYDPPGMTVNRYCASGLETIAIATAKIRMGMADCIIAGGVESMSMVPTAGWKTVPAYSIASTEPDYYLNMGLTAEAVADEYKISRDDQDQFSFHSHKKALQAIEAGHFEPGILAVNVEQVYLDENGKKQRKSFTVDTDEGPR